ncbi:hypothetical protein DFJ58DRAFT_717590 [Suillus subalutaceus]|uniref:uncharacterized protein n=1 Tax=Suillus subalutaceus TaxID=48586 RepID=UPI001B8815D2|nr:uncharacterized protein DFJ58DRAFT_717590 [Suillus subalutaceus]KAG1844839.1 hypothetical protein DFJ58DRAFT_717590 [Suillus subalutaceus]
MIARCHAKCWIIQLKEENQNLQLSTNQRGIKGHIIIYPQCPEGIAAILPPTVDDIVTPICVIFVGSCPPSREWLQEKAKPLIVRREKDITIDHTILDLMEEETLMPFHVNHILPDDVYDADEVMQLEDSLDSESHSVEPQSNFESVVVTDVDAVAVRHIKNKGGGYVQIPHDPFRMCHSQSSRGAL